MEYYDLNQSALYKCSSKRKLEELLLLDKGSLNNISKIINYKSFIIDKNGKSRSVAEPCLYLKRIQKRILSLLKRVEKPDWVISGTLGKNYIHNSELHIKNSSDYYLTMDIKSFYTNCSSDKVLHFFKNKLKTSIDVATILTKLTTHKFSIPTGSPTSQLLAYFSYEDMFHEINVKAKAYNCLFTLYVDDMTFSSCKKFNSEHLIKDITKILEKYDHKIKKSKTKIYKQKDYKVVTGVAISPERKPAVLNKHRKSITNYLRILDQQSNSEEKEKLLQKLKSKIVCARMIEKDIFSSTFQKLKNTK